MACSHHARGDRITEQAIQSVIKKIRLPNKDERRWYTLVPKVVERLNNTIGKGTGYTVSMLFKIYKRKDTDPNEYNNTIQEVKKNLKKYNNEIETRENKKRNTKFKIQENDYCWLTQKHKKPNGPSKFKA
jgi:hypothetical protein